MKPQRPQQDDGDRQIGEQGHLRSHHGHADAHDQHRGDQLQDLVGAAIEKAFQLVDVIVQHRHQAAAAVLLKKSQLQPLEVVVGLQPQTMLGCLGQVAPENVVQVLEQGLRRPDHKGEQRQHPQLLGDALDAEARQQGLLTTHHHIHSQADQGRRSEVKELVEQRTDHRRDHKTALGRQMTQQPNQGQRPCADGSIRHGSEAPEGLITGSQQTKQQGSAHIADPCRRSILSVSERCSEVRSAAITAATTTARSA